MQDDLKSRLQCRSLAPVVSVFNDVYSVPLGKQGRIFSFGAVVNKEYVLRSEIGKVTLNGPLYLREAVEAGQDEGYPYTFSPLPISSQVVRVW